MVRHLASRRSWRLFAGIGLVRRTLLRSTPGATALLLTLLLADGFAYAALPIPPDGAVFGLDPAVTASPAIPSEAPESDFEDEVRRIDAALALALGAAAEPPCRTRLLDVGRGAARPQADSLESLQTIEVECPDGPERLLAVFGERLRERGSSASVTAVAPDTWEVRVQHRLTHRLRFLPPGQAHPHGQPAGQARLVLVIDDLGDNLAVARELTRFAFPVTFAVLPRAPYAKDTLRLAMAAGREVILHQPMAPIRYPENDPGPGALFPGMADDTVTRLVEENLDMLPGIVGMNNHMGSRYTQDVRGMSAALDVLRRRNLFFLDSVTHPGTKGGQVARTLGLAHLERDVFLDVEHDARYVVFQLQKAESIALRKGQAVAIGHPFPTTMQGLRLWSRSRNAAVAIVPLRELLNVQAPPVRVESPPDPSPPALPTPSSPAWVVKPEPGVSIPPVVAPAVETPALRDEQGRQSIAPHDHPRAAPAIKSSLPSPAAPAKPRSSAPAAPPHPPKAPQGSAPPDGSVLDHLFKSLAPQGPDTQSPDNTPMPAVPGHGSTGGRKTAPAAPRPASGSAASPRAGEKTVTPEWGLTVTP